MDDVIREVRRIRDEDARSFGYDLQAIHRDLKEQERLSGRVVVSFSPKRINPTGERISRERLHTAPSASSEATISRD